MTAEICKPGFHQTLEPGQVFTLFDLAKGTKTVLIGDADGFILYPNLDFDTVNQSLLGNREKEYVHLRYEEAGTNIYIFNDITVRTIKPNQPKKDSIESD